MMSMGAPRGLARIEIEVRIIVGMWMVNTIWAETGARLLSCPDGTCESCACAVIRALEHTDHCVTMMSATTTK